MHEAQSKHLLFLFFTGPKHNPLFLIHTLPPSFHVCLQPPHASHYITALTCFVRRTAASPWALSFKPAIYISKVKIRNSFLCLSLWCFVLWDSSDARNKRWLDQNRKKDSCCHFHFCITQPAEILVVCCVSSGLKVDLALCCWGMKQWFLMLVRNNFYWDTCVFLPPVSSAYQLIDSSERLAAECEGNTGAVWPDVHFPN